MIVQTFRDKFWDTSPLRRFPEGCDPYNSVEETERQQAVLVDAMEKAWQACVKDLSQVPDPKYMIVSHFSWRLLYPDPLDGFEFFPYG